MKTTVKVYLKDEQGNKDWFVTPINLMTKSDVFYVIFYIFTP